MAPKIKWETDYDDLLFDFIQFRSEHPNGNLSDSIKEFKKYMTKEEQPFQWTEKLIEETCYYVAENRHYINSLTAQYSTLMEQFKKSKQQTNTISSDEEKLYGRCLVCGIAIKEGAKYCGSHWRSYQPESQPKIERIEVAGISSNWYPNNRLQHTVEIYFYEKVSEEKFPLIKEAIENALNNKELSDWHTQFLKESEEREEKAFNAGRELIPDLVPAPPEFRKYPSFQHYKKQTP